MKIINPESRDGFVTLHMSTRKISIPIGGEVEVTDQEFAEIKMVVDSFGLVSLTDEEVTSRKEPEVSDVTPLPAPVVEDVVEETEDDDEDPDEGDGSEDEPSPVPEHCPYTRKELEGEVRSQLLNILDELKIKR